MACYSRQDVKDIWNYAKANYIDRGMFRNDFEGLINKLGKDLNQHPEDMAKVLSAPKTIRDISVEQYKAYANRRRVKTNADTWLKVRNDPALVKALNMASHITYATRVLGHGPVSFGTHAAPYIYQPFSKGPMMLRNYVKSWGNFSDVQFEKMVRAIEGDPEFKEWNKASGGSIDPAQHLDDFQAYADWAARTYGRAVGAIPKGFAEISRRGSQQFQGLKLLRLEAMKSYWEKLPPAMRSPEARQSIADYVNHATGVSPEVSILRTRGGTSVAANAMFAPSLESARWLRLSDVAKTLYDLKFAKDPGVRRFAWYRMRDYTEMAAVYTAALHLNDMFLHGSGQSINYDPRGYDGLAFKRANGDAINITGGQTQTIRFLAREFSPQRDAKGHLLKSQPAFAQHGEILGKYLLGKASPIAGTATDLSFGESYGEGGKEAPLPVPWAPPPSKGVQPFTVPEYLAERQAPIPLSGAAQAILAAKHKGASLGEAATSGVIPLLVEGLLGGRYYKK